MNTNHIEVEIKYRLSTPLKSFLSQLEASGFKQQGEEHEIDTYFSRSDVDYMKTVECLRIRQKGDFSEITYKPASRKSDLSGIVAKKETNVTLKNVSQGSVAIQLLETIGMIKLVAVDKRRRTFKNTSDASISVLVDEIAHAGTFVEIEVMSHDVETAKQTIGDLAEKLSLSKQDIATKPYRDLVIDAQNSSTQGL